MKIRLLIISLLFLSISGFGQDASKVFDGVKDITLRNIGVIKKNNAIEGYFSFYQFDKVDRKTILYRLNLLDANLNELGTKDIQGPKEWSLISSGFDGNNFCFKFWDDKTKTIEMKVYDQEAKEVTSSSVKVNYKPGSNDFIKYSQLTTPDIYMSENNGFVDYIFNEPNNAFIVSYINGGTQKSWQETYEPDGKSKIMTPTYLNANENMILTGVSRMEKGMYNFKTDHSILANSTKDGRILFDMSTEFGDNHMVPVNAIFEGDKIVIVGLNYKTSKTYTRAPDGFAFIEIDSHGKLLKSNFKTFEESLGKFLPITDHHLQDDYYIYIHNIVRTNHNTNLIVAEKFKKATGGAGAVAIGVLAGGIVKLEFENMVMMECDPDGNVLKAEEIPKGKSITGGYPSYASLMSPYLLAFAAEVYGWMDYMYTTKSDDNSVVTFSFIDKDRLDPDAKKTKNFGQIKYQNGKFSVDRVPIKNEKADFSHLLPAQAGRVLQVNYFKKDKRLSMDMIKLN